MRVLPSFALMRRSRRGLARFTVVTGAAVAFFALWAGGAIAVFPESNVADYAGCLNTGGSSAGTFSQIAVGDAPSKACSPKQMLVHLSGGDITAVRTPPGSGLSGGTENGAATLSLAGSFALPQSCSDQQVAKWNNASGAWTCADENAYSNGTGLDLSSSGQFSVSPGYQLPQNCNNGDVVTSGGDNTWSCTSSVVNGVTTYTITDGASVGSFYDSATVGYDCPSGDVVTGGGFNTDNVDIKASAPNGYNGWYVRADGGLEGGSVTVYIQCLRVHTG